MSFDAHPSRPIASTKEPVAPEVKEAPTPVEKLVEIPTPPPPAAASATGDTAEVPTPEFTPNFELKIMGKKFEVPEEFRGLVKDEESQKKVREVFEKAYGLDEAKPRHESVRQERDTLRSNLAAVTNDIEEIKTLYQSGDLDGMFQKMNIPVEKILHWLQEKAQYQEMPPEQRAMVDARRAATQQARQFAQQNEQLRTQSHEQQVNALGYMLNLTLEKPEVKSFAEKYDQMSGQEGSFTQQVIEYGQAQWALTQKLALPDEAVAAVMSRYKAFMDSQPQAQQQAPAMIPVAQALPQSSTQKKGLPNIQGRSSSQASKDSKPKSIDDLKALYKKMASV